MDNLELNKIKTRLEANQDLMRSALKKSTYLKVGGAIVGWDGMFNVWLWFDSGCDCDFISDFISGFIYRINCVRLREP